MEEIIREQVRLLQEQRETVNSRMAAADENSMNYGLLHDRLSQQIAIIDGQIFSLIGQLQQHLNREI